MTDIKKVENLASKDSKITEAERKLNKTFSSFARVFDKDSSTYCTSEAEYNLKYLKCHELYANDILKHQGHVFLNEVYDMLGFPRTKTGALVGWVYDENNPNCYVKFEITEYGEFYILDFNVGGAPIDYLKD